MPSLLIESSDSMIKIRLISTVCNAVDIDYPYPTLMEL